MTVLAQQADPPHIVDRDHGRAARVMSDFEVRNASVRKLHLLDVQRDHPA